MISQRASGRLGKLARRIGLAVLFLVVPLSPLYLVGGPVWALVLLLIPSLYGSVLMLMGARRPQRSLLKAYRPFVSIVVPARNEARILIDTLRSINKLDYVDPDGRILYEVVVVDHGSTDETTSLINNTRHDRSVRVVKLPCESRPGKAVALNAALKHVRGDVICVLDADARIQHEFLTRAVQYLSQPLVGAVQCRKLVYSTGSNLLTRLQRGEYGVVKTLVQQGRSSVFGLTCLSGNGMLIKRDVLIKAGMWSEPALTEDVDLAFKIASIGYVVDYACDVAVHEEPVSSVSGFLRQRIRWAEGFVQLLIDVVPEFLLCSRVPIGRRLDGLLLVLIPILLPTGFWASLVLIAIRQPIIREPLVPLTALLASVTLVLMVLMIAGFRRYEGRGSPWARLEIARPVMLMIYYLHTLLVVPIALFRYFAAAGEVQHHWMKTAHMGPSD